MGNRTTEFLEGGPAMYTHLTSYDQTRHVAALARSGAYDGCGRRQSHPVRRIRHALAGLARHLRPQPVGTVAPAV